MVQFALYSGSFEHAFEPLSIDADHTIEQTRMPGAMTGILAGSKPS